MDKKRGQPKASPTNYLNHHFTTTYEAIQHFTEALHRDLGVIVTPVCDGAIHRMDDPNGKRGNLACWYVCHLDGVPHCSYGNWRTGETFNATVRCRGGAAGAIYRSNPHLRLAPSERPSRLQAQTQAARRAQALWGGGTPATVDHPYIARKRVPALNVRETGGWLLVPIWDVAGELVNIQRIDRDGTKRFLKDGRIRGCFGLVGAQHLPLEGTLYIAEGWATAATLHAQMRLPVAAAMNAGNLAPVAKALTEALPELVLIIAADNDHRTAGNPGITKATEAAEAVGAGLVWPPCCGRDCGCTDFNDVAHCGRARV